MIQMRLLADDWVEGAGLSCRGSAPAHSLARRMLVKGADHRAEVVLTDRNGAALLRGPLGAFAAISGPEAEAPVRFNPHVPGTAPPASRGPGGARVARHPRRRGDAP